MLLMKVIAREGQKYLKMFRLDDRITTNPLLGSPLLMASIIAFYLLLSLKWLPSFMANRKPYKVEGIMKLYNVLQILLNLFVCYDSITTILNMPDYSFTCQRCERDDRRPETMRFARCAIFYYSLKYFDMFDTIFFLLRKKFRQVTFLHVYHHSIMIFGTFAYCAVLFGSHFTSTGVINSFIHVVMYTYYLIAAMKPNIDLKPLKKTLTRMQLIQFILLGIHFSFPLVNNWCKLNTFWLWIAYTQNFFMIMLFLNFYYKAYVRNSNKNKIK
uniref:Elongation of very long chain fatty acids protein n=1 Tax=Stomoxys calcitrans TaxID=35570 RepID=A0A1I8PY53_STOCA